MSRKQGMSISLADYPNLSITCALSTVITISNMTHMLNDKGVTFMFIGSSRDYDGDCYNMVDPLTGTVYHTRDVTWLRRMYYTKADASSQGELQFNRDYLNTANENIAATADDDEDNEEDEGTKDGTNAVDPVTEGEIPDDAVTVPTSNVTIPNTDRSGRAVWVCEIYKALQGSMETRTTRSDNETAETAILNAEMYGPTEVGLTPVEDMFYSAMNDLYNLHFLSMIELPAIDCAPAKLNLVGAGLGGGLENTTELRTMKYDEAMASEDKDNWEEAVDQEKSKFNKYKVFKSTPIEDVPKDAKILTSTWSMKKKAYGKFCARLIAGGFEQGEQEHYSENDISSPDVNHIVVRICLILHIIVAWQAWIVDVGGSFLNDQFDKGEVLYMKVPQGFEKFYPRNVRLLLLRSLYGTK